MFSPFKIYQDALLVANHDASVTALTKLLILRDDYFITRFRMCMTDKTILDTNAMLSMV